MKFITLLFSILTLDSYGQVTKTVDSNSKNLPVYFLDSIRMDKNQLFFDPSKISEINVVKEKDTTTQNYGMIYIKSKKPKDFNFLTLPDIEKTYTKGISTSTLFMVDNEFLKDNVAAPFLRLGCQRQFTNINTTIMAVNCGKLLLGFFRGASF